MNCAINQANVNNTPIVKSKSNIENSSSSHSMLFERDEVEEEDEDESENILDDSEIRPQIEYISS